MKLKKFVRWSDYYNKFQFELGENDLPNSCGIEEIGQYIHTWLAQGHKVEIFRPEAILDTLTEEAQANGEYT